MLNFDRFFMISEEACYLVFRVYLGLTSCWFGVNLGLAWGLGFLKGWFRVMMGFVRICFKVGLGFI